MVNKTLTSVVLCLLFFIQNGFSEDINPVSFFEQANNSYTASDYDKAVELYSRVIDAGYESPALYYNLGNAYYRTGKLGYAVLYYEKALKISPGDEDIRHNLALANLRTVDRIETLPEFFIFRWWESLLGLQTLTGWAYTALFVYLLLLASVGFYFLSGRAGRQKAAITAGIGSAALLLVTVTILLVNYNREVNLKQGVIISNSAAVMLSPEGSAAEAFVVHEGLKVILVDRVNDWHQIKLIDGKTGWIKNREFKII